MRKTLEDYPNLIKEFDFKKNTPLTPKDFSFGSGKKIWWKCSKEHEWIASITNRTSGLNCPYCSGQKVSKENNLKFIFPNIAKEWHPIKNKDLKPEDVTKASGKKVWWLCSKGHEYKHSVSYRARGMNCPYCANKKVNKDNNLEFKFPNIAKEWHPTKNNDLKSADVIYGSIKKVWWLCVKGHEWKSSIIQRTKSSGSNCPKCSGQSSKPEFRILSELETIFKEVDSKYKLKKTEIDIFIKDINVGIEYDGSYFHKNRKITDEKKNIFLKENSIKLIRVRHEPLPKIDSFDVIVKKDELTKEDLNNIVKSIYNFCNKDNKNLIKEYLTYKSFINEKSFNKYLSYFPSPIPEKSLASFNIKFTNEWNYTKNYPLTPHSFSVSSHSKVWWKCSKGHEWITSINHRTSGSNCPYCSGKKTSNDNNIKYLFPNIAKEWHPIKNKDLTPEDVTKSSRKKVWWLCSKGHEWLTFVFNRTKGRNCPYCTNLKASKENNLKFIFPNIAKEWHPIKNKDLKPEDITKASGKKVWWLCSKGHEWLAFVFNRTKGQGCPYCLNIKRKSLS